MGIRQKLIYVCDNCGQEFEEGIEIRFFRGDVVTADETKVFVKMNSMLCKKCTKLLLNIEGKNQISDQQIMINQQEEEEEEFIEQDSIIKEDELLLKGKYLVLYKIKDEQDEQNLAKMYGYQDVKSLRKNCEKSLIGIYISTDRYINDLPKNYKISNIELINQMSFGIPNIVKTEAYIISNSFALVEKDKFKLKINDDDDDDDLNNINDVFENDNLEDIYDDNIV